MSDTPASKRFLGERPASAWSATDIARLCPKIPTLVPTWKTCGKPGCRCARGELHGPYWSLRWHDGPVHRRRHVRPGDLAAVRAEVGRRRAERARLRAELAEAVAVLDGLRQLARELEAEGRGREGWR